MSAAAMKRIYIFFLVVVATGVAGTIDFPESLAVAAIKSRLAVREPITLSGGVVVRSAGLGAMVGIRDSIPVVGNPSRKVDYISYADGRKVEADSAQAAAARMHIWELLDLSLLPSRLAASDISRGKFSIAKRLNDGLVKVKLSLPKESGFEFTGTLFIEPDPPYRVVKMIYKAKRSDSNIFVEWNFAERAETDFPKRIELNFTTQILGMPLENIYQTMYIK